jgi:hypothetical protein
MVDITDPSNLFVKVTVDQVGATKVGITGDRLFVFRHEEAIN